MNDPFLCGGCGGTLFVLDAKNIGSFVCANHRCGKWFVNLQSNVELRNGDCVLSCKISREDYDYLVMNQVDSALFKVISKTVEDFMVSARTAPKATSAPTQPPQSNPFYPFP